MSQSQGLVPSWTEGEPSMPLLGLALATALAQVISEEPVEPASATPVVWRSSRQVIAFSMGAAAWPGLRAIGPLAARPGWAPFAGTGFALLASYRYNALYFGGAELLLGASGDLFVTRSGRPAGVPVNRTGDPAPDLWMLSTGVALSADAQIQRATGPLRPFAAAGLGALDLTIGTEEPGLASQTEEQFLGRWRPLAWLGAGLDYRFGPPELCWGLVTEIRVHAVNMGRPGRLAPSATSLRGPIYTLTLGLLLGLQ